MHYIIVWDTYQGDFLLSFQTFTFADSRSRKALFFGEILDDEDFFHMIFDRELKSRSLISFYVCLI